MRILDFGAGWQAWHTQRMRALGLNVTAYDFGRNFDPAVHFQQALEYRYDAVFLSNVVNVHCTLHALERTLAQAAVATADDGFCLMNLPQSPRKLAGLTPHNLESVLQVLFCEVDRLTEEKCPVWLCRGPVWSRCMDVVSLGEDFTETEIACANIRPSGAVGPNALIPRVLMRILGEGLRQAS